MSELDDAPGRPVSDRPPVDRCRFEAWVYGRAVSRGMPLPASGGGGFRIETGLPHEMRRYVFPAVSPDLVAVAKAISEPRVFVKAFVTAADLARALPPGWEIQPPGYMMIRDGAAAGDAPLLPPGYSLAVGLDGSTTVATITALDGNCAASGRAADYDGYRVYDQIVTEPEHLRRGLGRAVMAALEPSRDKVPLLVATEAGRSLYMALGWRVVAPYTSAVLPG